VSAARTLDRRRPRAAGTVVSGRRAAAAVVAAACLAAGSALAAGPAPAGATACSGCHGASPAASVGPPIAGRPAAELSAAMEEFRTGSRPATVMQRIARGFTPEESRAIAEWWAATKAEAKP
jgi:sulfide dehydrogenase cytochrome subunit